MPKKKAKHPKHPRTAPSSAKMVAPPAAELEGIEFDARRAERLETAAYLKASRTPLAVIDIAEHATALAETTIQKVMELHPPPPPAC